MTNIGDGIFSHCCNLVSIIVDPANPVYDSRDNCNAIIETKTNTLIAGCKKTIIPEGIEHIGKASFDNVDIASVTIPYSVLSIGEFAFLGCSNLTSVLIPNSIPDIKRGAFAGCNKLKEIIIPQGTKQRFEQMEGLYGLQALLVEK